MIPVILFFHQLMGLASQAAGLPGMQQQVQDMGRKALGAFGQQDLLRLAGSQGLVYLAGGYTGNPHGHGFEDLVL